MSACSDSDLADSGSSEAQSSAEEEESSEEAVPKVELPDRSTRGARLQGLLDEQDSADEDFWKQEFFAEEARDDRYRTESESEDVADTDFSESEADSDSDVEDDRADRPRKKGGLKPPGTQKKPAAGQAATKGAKPPGKPAAQSLPPELSGTVEEFAAEAPTLRQSTRQRVEEAQKERQRIDQIKPKRKAPERPEARPLTQAELLAEAAYTELDNLRSLEAHLAAEEEFKKKAAIKRSKYSGPLIRFRSKSINSEAVVHFEIMNMLPPPEFEASAAPEPTDESICVITGRAAKYRDPDTGLPYADVAAYQELQLQLQQGAARSLKKQHANNAGRKPKRECSSTSAQQQLPRAEPASPEPASVGRLLSSQQALPGTGQQSPQALLKTQAAAQQPHQMVVQPAQSLLMQPTPDPMAMPPVWQPSQPTAPVPQGGQQNSLDMTAIAASPADL
ncbi:hypothetical protein WJX74_000389 [Apatococcus lobatus]|uniref:Vps72/YL1 C-terminal domain-containing protein n=1 Tax=Apatococcus lobatus TaxID=904363 RepID=A0AAW1QI96_9CHLO